MTAQRKALMIFKHDDERKPGSCNHAADNGLETLCGLPMVSSRVIHWNRCDGEPVECERCQAAMTAQRPTKATKALVHGGRPPRL